jgi:biotin transporter BioY
MNEVSNGKKTEGMHLAFTQPIRQLAKPSRAFFYGSCFIIASMLAAVLAEHFADHNNVVMTFWCILISCFTFAGCFMMWGHAAARVFGNSGQKPW